MKGLADGRRPEVRRIVRQARRDAEAAFVDRLRALGVRSDCGRSHEHSPDCYRLAADVLRLSPADAEIRLLVDAALRREESGFTNLPAAERTRVGIERYVRGAAFTLFNRLAALRALEVRGHVDETVMRRPAYGGRSLREYRIAQAEPALSADRVTELALREGFAAAAEQIGSLFEPDDPYAATLPGPAQARGLMKVFGEDVTEDDLRADDILGWTYQYWQDEAREAFRAGRGRGRRTAADADDMAAINCLYTPHWVVRALVDNSLGRLLLERRGCLEAALAHRWSEDELRQPAGDTVGEFCRYLIRPTGTPDESLAGRPLRSIRVLDPACGSGHFLIYAFEVLWRAYREEEPDIAPAEHAASILEHNLFGIDIDLRACELAALGLYLKAREYAPEMRPRGLNVICADNRLTDGAKTEAFLHQLGDDRELRRVAEQLLGDLRSTAEIGSLLRVRGPFLRLLDQRVPSKTNGGAQMVLGQRDRTLTEVIDALHDFERSAVERQDMGGRLFAADAERSIGLVAALARDYDVVLMNPPYNKRQELPAVAREYLAERYPRTQHNIYSAFIEQTVELARPGGFVGMLTPLAYMYLRQFQVLRTEILGQIAPPEVLLEFGWDILDPAQIQTAATVVRRLKVSEPNRERVFVDLTAPAGSVAKEAAFIAAATGNRAAGNAEDVYLSTPTEMTKVPGSPFAYWVPRHLLDTFERFPPLDRDNARTPKAVKIADSKQGLATADDARNLRRWWEVPPATIGVSRSWVPFIKGEQYARWYHDPSLVVLWANDGDALRTFDRAVIRNPGFYFREGLTWQLVSAHRRVRTRYLPPGSIFGHKGPSAFQPDPRTIWPLLGFLNSALCNLLMLVLTTERGWEVGQVSLLPIAPEILGSEGLAAAARELHDLHLAWDTGRPTSTRFSAPRLLQAASGDRQPATGHPFAEAFTWPSSSAWAAIDALRGSTESSLGELGQLVARRRRHLEARIAELEREVDDEVFRCYGLAAEAEEIRATLQRRLGTVVDEGGDDSKDDESEESEAGGGEIESLAGYYACRAVAAAEDGVVPANERETGNLLQRVRRLLVDDWGEARAQRLEEELEDALGKPLSAWLLNDWFPLHLREFRNRPICWQLWSGRRGRRAVAPAFICFLDYHRLGADTVRLVQGRYVRPALDRLRGELDRLGRESSEAGVTGSKEAGRARRAAEAAREREAELRDFDAALTSLIEDPPSAPAVPAAASWVRSKIAEVSGNGYRPVVDYGVLVNISPLIQAGVMHPAADGIRAR